MILDGIGIVGWPEKCFVMFFWIFLNWMSQSLILFKKLVVMCHSLLLAIFIGELFCVFSGLQGFSGLWPTKARKVLGKPEPKQKKPMFCFFFLLKEKKKQIFKVLCHWSQWALGIICPHRNTQMGFVGKQNGISSSSCIWKNTHKKTNVGQGSV